MKKIDLLGMEVKDYSVRECMHLASEYLNNGVLNVIYFLSKDVLLEARDSEELRGYINEMDVTVIATSDILHAADISSKSREHEIDRNLLLKGLLRKIDREKKKIFLISVSQEKLDNLKATLQKFESDLIFAGGIAYDPKGENGAGEDDVVNEINSVIPDVIFSDLPTPDQERFISREKMKINAKLMVALKDDMLKVKEDGTIKNGGITNFFSKTIFKSIADKYNKN